MQKFINQEYVTCCASVFKFMAEIDILLKVFMKR